jgi:hypothetical protein
VHGDGAMHALNGLCIAMANDPFGSSLEPPGPRISLAAPQTVAAGFKMTQASPIQRARCKGMINGGFNACCEVVDEGKAAVGAVFGAVGERLRWRYSG